LAGDVFGGLQLERPLQDLLGAFVERMGLAGEDVREYIRRFEEAGVDQLIFVMQAGKNKHEDICESLELFGKEVLPEFKERDEKHVAAKAKRLEPVIEQAMARKVDDAPRMPDDFVMRAIPKAMVEMSNNDQGRAWLEKFRADRAAGNRDESLGILG
jgi:hypothetical protein